MRYTVTLLENENSNKNALLQKKVIPVNFTKLEKIVGRSIPENLKKEFKLKKNL